MENQFSIGPFFGVRSDVDEMYIPDTAASDMLNVRIVDGKPIVRNGFQHLSGVPTGFTYCAGLCPLRGFDSSSGNELFEYISFETRSGTMKPYSVNPLTGVRSEIKNGTTSLNLTVAEWNATAYDDTAYAHYIGGLTYKHSLTDNTSWTSVDASQPPVPTTAPTVEFTVTEDDSHAATTLNWDGLAALTNNGGGATNVSFVSVSSHAVNIDFPTVSGVDNTNYDFTLDMNSTAAGIQDWSAVSFIEFSITQSLSGSNGKWALLAPYDSSIVVKLINNDGSPITITMDVSVDRQIGTSSVVHKVKASFPTSKVTTDWDNARKVRIQIADYYPSHLTQNVRMSVSPIVPNTATDINPTLSDTVKVRFGYSYYDSSRDVESGDLKASRWYRMATDADQRYYKDDGDQAFLGNKPSITVTTVVQSNVDQYRLYVWFDDFDVWQLIGTYDLSDLSQDVDLSFTNIRALPSRRYRAYTPVGTGTMWIGTYGGALVYFKQDTQSNVKITGVGKPTQFYDPNYDLSSDLSRGNTLNMSPNLDDMPIWGNQAGKSLIALGNRGAYASVGDGTPSSLTAFKRLPNSKGLVGMRAACNWRDDNSSEGIAFIGNDWELWFVAAFPGFDGQDNYRMTQMSLPIQGLIRTFLTSNSANPNVLRLHIGVDDRSDSLWMFYNKRAIRLTRPTASGQREFELYEYGASGWYRFALDSYYGIRIIRDTGVLDEAEYDSTNNWALIQGANRDDGSPVSSAYWTSKKFNEGVNSRVWDVLVERDNFTDTPSVTIVSDRATNTKTCATGKHHLRFPMTQQGWNHTFTVTLTANSSAVTKLTVTRRFPASRRYAA